MNKQVAQETGKKEGSSERDEDGLDQTNTGQEQMEGRNGNSVLFVVESR